MNGVERIRVGEIELAYEVLGQREDAPVVLVMGLGAQLHYWPTDFCRMLVARGLQVVRFDNRDTGESTHLPAGAEPYNLRDMAADAVGLAQALGFDSAHFVGVSLGGMIVQTAAIEFPERVRSLVSISSTTGEQGVGGARPDAIAALLSPPGDTREAMADRAVMLSEVIGSPGFELDLDWLRWRAEVAFDRGYDPEGVRRQMAAVLAAPDRTPRLREVRVPALVIHGAADPLVDVSGGTATAAAVPSATLLVIDGMAHDLPPGVWPRMVDAIVATVRRAERG